MDKQTAINLAGSASRLARLLGITKSAVSLWGSSVPDSRVWQLKCIKPEWFDAPGIEVEVLRGTAKKQEARRRALAQVSERNRLGETPAHVLRNNG